jgi:hypothetical protein
MRVRSFPQQPDGVKFVLQSGAMKGQVCPISFIRVIFPSHAGISIHNNPAVVNESWPPTKWNVDPATAPSRSPPHSEVTVIRTDSSMSFSDLNGKQLFQQSEISPRPAIVNGENTYHAELYAKLWNLYEGFYGLGQHQASR